MVKKIVFFFLIFCGSIQLIFATYRSGVEFRSAAFFPTSDRFRSIYGTASASYQLEGSTRFYQYLDGWANFDWTYANGKSDHLLDPTKVQIGNISLGLKSPYPYSKYFIPYIGLGPSFSKIWLKNQSQCGSEHVSKWAYGLMAKIGMNCSINARIFLDLFVDYLYQPVHFKTHVDIGGFKTGAGIGVKF